MEMSYTQEGIATQKKVADVMLEDNTRKQLLNQLKSVKDLPSISSET